MHVQYKDNPDATYNKEQQTIAGTSDFDISWGTTDLNKVLHGHLDLLLVLFTLGKLSVDLAPQAYQ